MLNVLCCTGFWKHNLTMTVYLFLTFHCKYNPYLEDMYLKPSHLSVLVINKETYKASVCLYKYDMYTLDFNRVYNKKVYKGTLTYGA